MLHRYRGDQILFYRDMEQRSSSTDAFGMPTRAKIAANRKPTAGIGSQSWRAINEETREVRDNFDSWAGA
jgi:hypothetical protein